MNARDRLQIDRLGSPSFDEWREIIERLADQHTSLEVWCEEMIEALWNLEYAEAENRARDEEADRRIRQALEEKVKKERKP